MKILRLFDTLLFIFLITSPLFLAAFQPNFSENSAQSELQKIHNGLSLMDGSFADEYPEQVMSMMFISPEDKVLEIGGNIGRNSCVISSILDDSRNLVVAESNSQIAADLIANRELNHLFFHVEMAAISKIPLIQSGWITVPGETPPAGFFKVDTISYDELKEKYNISFDVLVADCEGALYYILHDDASLLHDVNLIILENDYQNRVHYVSVYSKLISHGFHLVYNKAGGWNPCYNEFYQVWKKI